MKMKKVLVMLLVVLLVLSPVVYAVDSNDYCSGFWGSIKCFLFGNQCGNVNQLGD